MIFPRPTIAASTGIGITILARFAASGSNRLEAALRTSAAHRFVDDVFPAARHAVLGVRARSHRSIAAAVQSVAEDSVSNVCRVYSYLVCSSRLGLSHQ